MKYIIENGKSQITIFGEGECVRVLINPKRIFIFEVFKIFVENAVEPRHAQSVYDGLLSK